MCDILKIIMRGVFALRRMPPLLVVKGVVYGKKKR